jgi:hypothetical protein
LICLLKGTGGLPCGIGSGIGDLRFGIRYFICDASGLLFGNASFEMQSTIMLPRILDTLEAGLPIPDTQIGLDYEWSILASTDNECCLQDA